ncbi:MAG: PqqD family protein [bacterium]|nr:PqqD family protein [bacterium]
MSKCIISNPDIVFREEGDEALLFDPEKGTVKILNEVGTFIWRLCDGTRTKDDIAKEVECKYEADMKTIKEDLNKFIEKLEASGFIKHI